MSTAPEMKQASPEHLAKVEAYAEPMVDYIQQFQPTAGMEVLLYVIVRSFLDAGMQPGVTHLDAFDKYMAAARVTQEKNLEHAKATKQ